jgi:hypothetical protein
MMGLILVAELALVAGWWIKRKRTAITNSLSGGGRVPFAIRPLARRLESHISFASAFDRAVAGHLVRGLRSFVHTAGCEQLVVAGLCQIRSRLKAKGGLR